MIRKLSIVAVLLAATLCVWAATSRSSPPSVDGVIYQVDQERHGIGVVASERELWFPCTQDTTYTIQGFAASFNDLAVGQRVRVTYDSFNNNALMVAVDPPPS